MDGPWGLDDDDQDPGTGADGVGTPIFEFRPFYFPPYIGTSILNPKKNHIRNIHIDQRDPIEHGSNPRAGRQQQSLWRDDHKVQISGSYDHSADLNRRPCDENYD